FISYPSALLATRSQYRSGVRNGTWQVRRNSPHTVQSAIARRGQRPQAVHRHPLRHSELAMDQASTSAAKPTTTKESRRALISSFLGSTVEYYDFLLYGSAAGLVFPHLFFSDEMDPTLGMALSFVILLAGYATRPIGGVLFGHFGDRFGRKNMLFITLMMMGLVSVGIGLMPTYDTIGVAAPLLLVLL